MCVSNIQFILIQWCRCFSCHVFSVFVFSVWFMFCDGVATTYDECDKYSIWYACIPSLCFMNMCDTLCNVHSMMFTRNALHQHCLSATLHSLWKILLTINIYKYIHLFIFLFTYEEILHQRHSTLEIAADVQLTNSQETQAPAEAQDITWLSLVSGVLRICARCSLETAPSFRTSKPHQLL